MSCFIVGPRSPLRWHEFRTWLISHLRVKILHATGCENGCFGPCAKPLMGRHIRHLFYRIRTNSHSVKHTQTLIIAHYAWIFCLRSCDDAFWNTHWYNHRLHTMHSLRICTGQFIKHFHTTLLTQVNHKLKHVPPNALYACCWERSSK